MGLVIRGVDSGGRELTIDIDKQEKMPAILYLILSRERIPADI